jgi:hypothetical protein
MQDESDNKNNNNTKAIKGTPMIFFWHYGTGNNFFEINILLHVGVDVQNFTSFSLTPFYRITILIVQNEQRLTKLCWAFFRILFFTISVQLD